jgi:hypothetical protein
MLLNAAAKKRSGAIDGSGKERCQSKVINLGIRFWSQIYCFLTRIAQLFKSKKREYEVKRCVSDGYFILTAFLIIDFEEFFACCRKKLSILRCLSIVQHKVTCEKTKRLRSISL